MSNYQKKERKMIKRKLALFLAVSFFSSTIIFGTEYPENNAYAYNRQSEQTIIQMTEDGKEQAKREAAMERLKKIRAEREIAEEKQRRKEMDIEELITVTCEDYGICSDVPLAIARLETGHFTSSAYLNKNNPGGMSINEVPITYSTREEGVEAFISNLAENYFGIGLTTPETIAQKYCPVNADNWANMVRQLM